MLAEKVFMDETQEPERDITDNAQASVSTSNDGSVPQEDTQDPSTVLDAHEE